MSPIDKRTFAYLLFSVSGFTFLFFLGFPFGNHNESYLWVADFRNLGIIDLFTGRLRAVAGFRPLGTALARTTYALSGGEIWLQQLCNWLFALSAWAMLFAFAHERYLLSLITFVVGGVFFSGYIFLFHLHGVFYGPLLVYVALLIVLSRREPVGSRSATFLLLVTILVSLFHPFALLIYAFFIAAETGVMWRRTDRRRLLLNVLLLIATVLAVHFSIPNLKPLTVEFRLLGFLTSFKMVEVNHIISGVAYILSLTILVTIDVIQDWRVLWMVLATVFTVLLAYLGIPALLVWIGLALVKCAMQKEWRLAALVFSCLLLPLATATGSPTYTIFVLMAAAFVTAFGYDKAESFMQGHYRAVYVLVACLACLWVVIKSGAHVPAISRLVNPILAEKEKTLQLERIIRWHKVSTFSSERLAFVDRAEDPVTSRNAIDRKYRPPTSQEYLDAFLLASVPGDVNQSSALMITFGGRQIHGRELVYNVPGCWNDSAMVWR